MYDTQKIGITAFKTKTPPLNGNIFREKEDFLVQEIEIDNSVLTIGKEQQPLNQVDKKDFLVFTLVKKGTTTQDALKIISRENHLSIKRLGYLGNKDRNAVTAQRISIFKGDPQRIKTQYNSFYLKDLEYSESGCKIGNLYGNRFTVRIRDVSNAEILDNFLKEAMNGIPNFYGPQHFGTSATNLKISRSIINRDFKQAVYMFLFEDRDESETAKQARKVMRESFSGKFSDESEPNQAGENEVIEGLPGFFSTEREILRYLLTNRHDYIGALRLVPKYFRLLIIQALQAYLFNLTLSKLIAGGNVPQTIPTIGYDLDIDAMEPSIKETIASVLEQENFTNLSKFKINEMPEASMKTFLRNALIYPENFSYLIDGNDVILSFDLKKGAYATIVLLELLKHLN